MPNGDPEIRATAISSLCAFLEQDFHIVKSAAELLCYIYDLNQSKDKFYFILNKDQKLITEFPLEHERRFVFETQKARPLLYSFPLSVIALLATFFVTQKRKYLDYAKKYAEKILKTDFRNDYCGKSAIAMSILYFFSISSSLFKLISVLFIFCIAVLCFKLFP